MATLTIEHLDVPSSGRGTRRMEEARRRSADELAGRTVWCAAKALSAMLHRAAEPDVAVAWLQEDLDPDHTGRVDAQDVVVLHDDLALELAPALRDRGAHVVWHLSAGAALPHERTTAIDAYVIGWPTGASGIAAVIPCPGVMVAKEMPSAELGWSTMLADVVHSDRDETVGGMLHARPAVAAR